ncbi:uncharacterized membrane protein YgdD (TMEM256/DUF423 family) [Actinoplanes lutulentus]|uniref:Uncharacterized protein n=1 Tax=Actinoplanes lutulentus TaxID=1287878 RepID=A0A327ZHG3_9ACTN|nr:hypothetical protein [Actinoplanes lutulentus]MBB2941946.1 uncharacterized membrane protein YgdD (TMEM256/DUF423 family) [Actinoplanes lutulentus]RAK39859.1 hypothetical protein B0I29_104398 [Actinoplanes lutulentus]
MITNVVANLVAAAVIYLGGVMIGLFPREPKAVASAVTAVLLAAAYGAMLATRLLRQESRRSARAVGLVFFSGSLVIANIGGVETDPFINSPLGLAWASILLLGGITLAILRLRHRKRVLADGRKINGLSWYEPR